MPIEPLHKKTLNLRAGDWEYLESVYGLRGVPTSILVRRLVSRHVDDLRKRETPVPDNLLSD